MVEFKIRRLGPDDLEKGFLESLLNLTVVDLTPEAAKKVFEQIINNPVYNVFVAVLTTGEIIGTASLFVTQRFIHSGGKVGHLEDVATKKGYERMGVGSALILAVMDEALKRGCYKVILDCGERNVSFYEKFGFRKKEHQMRFDL